MDHGVAIRLIALNNVIKGDDPQYILRHILRWYSKTFYTPLHVVEELPLEDVLLAYYEENYAEYKEPELEKEIASLLETDAEREARLRKEDEDKVTEKQLMETADASKIFMKPNKDDVGFGSGVIENLQKLASQTNVLTDKIEENKGILSSLPKDVSISFLNDNENLDLDQDTFGLLNTLEKPEPDL